MASQTNRTRRAMMMIRAYIVYHARKAEQARREAESWLYLLEWARLGGNSSDRIPGEIIRG